MDEEMRGCDGSFGRTRQNHKVTHLAPDRRDNVSYTERHPAATVQRTAETSLPLIAASLSCLAENALLYFTLFVLL